MKNIALLLLLYPLCHFSNAQIIADHNSVDMYDKIPQQWVDEVKKMWVSVAGASHAMAYQAGLGRLFENDPSRPSTSQFEGEPKPYRDTHLRINMAFRGTHDSPTAWEYTNGQAQWWTNQVARERIKAYLQYCHDNGPALYATMYGWSFDAQFDNPPGGEFDPTYHVRWAGSTREGPDGNLIWGLDIEDKTITGNSVSMNTYIETMNEYMQYCINNGIDTKLIFSTGPVDNNGTQGWAKGERGYQQYLKWKYIRDYVNNSSSAYLMDYADILSYNNSNDLETTSWQDNSGALQTYPMIHPDNLEGGDTGHIGYNGAERLGKAMWWLLARMAGWDGKPLSTISTQNDNSEKIIITERDGLLQIKSKQNITGTMISLINISGQTLQKKMIKGNICEINIDDFPSGTYLVVVALDRPYSKMIVKH